MEEAKHQRLCLNCGKKFEPREKRGINWEQKFWWISHAYQEQHKSIRNIFDAWERQIRSSYMQNLILGLMAYIFGLLVGIFIVMRYLGKW